MRLRFGLIGNLALSFIALTLVMQAANHLSGSDFRDATFRKQEYDRVIQIAQQIEPRLHREEYRLRAETHALQQQLETALTSQRRFGRDNIAALLDAATAEAALDDVEMTDENGRITYRRNGTPGDNEQSRFWGTEEALQGSAVTSMAPISDGAEMVHSEPLRRDDRVIGTLSVGRRLGQHFVDTLSKDHGSDIALISRNGTNVASSRTLEGSIDSGAIAEAFTQKIPVYRFDAAHRTTRVYFPLQIVDEGWILLAEVDSSAAIAAHDRYNRTQLLVALAVMCASILAMLLIVWFSLRPLRSLRLRAERIYREISGTPLHGTRRVDDIEGLVRVLNAQTDLLEQRNSELSAQRADLRVSSKAFETQQPTVITDTAGRILKINRAYAQMSGFDEDVLVGTVIRLFIDAPRVTPLDAASGESLGQTGCWHCEGSGQRKNGEVYPQKISACAVHDDAGQMTHLIFTFVDLSEHNSIEKKLRELSLLDSLTRLPNRTALIERLRQTATSTRPAPAFSALMMVNLDHFTSLNDTQGHAIGDQLLDQVGKRLTALMRSDDTVARIGGDEFAIILDGLAASPDDAQARTTLVGEKILAELRHSYFLNDSEYRSTCSLGATVFGTSEFSAETLMMQADLALHRAKTLGRDTLCFFAPSMQQRVIERVALEQNLQEALDQRQFMLHYQPQVTASGKVIGAEALIRWQHPQRGMVSPASFIPLAEETGEIIPMGRWVLQSACEQLRKWASIPAFANLTLAVNVCARQLHHEEFVDQVLTALDISNANPALLKLELTESMLVEHTEELILKMDTLRKRGLSFSLDDFGTGYSSLTYLKRLPIDQLKIDQSFVRDVLTDPNDAVIAKTIVGLARNLGLNVIAEGVETREQQQFLEEVGCLTYQGYFFSRPLDIEHFERFVRQPPSPEDAA